MDSPGPLDLPESVWLKILRHLSADNLLSWTNLTEVERKNFVLGNRLFHLCGDKDLWRQIIWKGGKVKPVVLRKIIKFLGPHTEKICLHGGSSKSQKLTIPESFLHSIQSRCTRLKHIQLFNCALDHHFAPLRKLPLSIEFVDLFGVDWINLPRKDLRLGSLSSPFFKLKKRYKDLKSVQVSEEFGRYWLTPSDHRCLLEINQNKKFQRYADL